MGKKDLASKVFFRNPRNFASICNGVLFSGEDVIVTTELLDDETENIDFKSNTDTYLDVSKRWNRGNASICLLALEEQSKIDYAMVVRNLLKEALVYSKQVKDKREKHHDLKDLCDDEYLSGFSKDDYLIPVITIVVYLGDKKWDAKTELIEMLHVDKRLKSYINNFKITVYDYHDYDDFSAFNKDIQMLFNMLKAKNDEKSMMDVLRTKQYISLELAQAFEQLLGIKYSRKHFVTTNEGKCIEVCKAWDDHYNSGIKEGEKKGIMNTLVDLVKDGIIDTNIAASKAGMSIKEFEALCK